MLQPATRKRLLILALIASLVLVCLLAGLRSYVNSGAFRRTLLERANRNIPGSVLFKDQRLGWSLGYLAVRDLQIKAAGGNVLAEAGRVEISMFWPALLWRAIDVRRLTIRDADIDLAVGTAGRLLLADALTPPPSGVQGEKAGPGQSFPWQVRVGQLIVEKTDLSYAQPASDRSGRAGGVSLRASLNLAARKGKADLQVEQLDFTASGARRQVKGLALQVSYSGKASSLLSATLKTGGTSLAVHGRVFTRDKRLSVEGTAGLEADLAEWADWIPDINSLSGKAKAEAEISGALDDPDISLDLDLHQATLARAAVSRVAAKLDLHQRRIKVEKVSGAGPWGAFELSGEIDLQPVFALTFSRQTGSLDALTYQFQATGRDLALRKMPFFASPFSADLLARVQLKGTGISSENARADADIDIKTDNLKTKDSAQPVKGGCQARLEWAKQTLSIVQGRAAVGASELNFQGDVNTAAGTLALKSDLSAPQLAELGDFIGITLPAGQAKLNFSANGNWSRPLLKSTLLAENLVLGGHSLGRLLAEASLDDKGVIHLPRLVLENQGGLLQGSATLEMKQTDGAWRSDPGLSGTFDLEKLQPVDFDVALPFRADVTGRMTMSGTLKNPLFQARLDNSRLAWHSLDGSVDGDLRWEWTAGRLTAGDLQWTRDDSLVTLEGTSDWRDPDSGKWASMPRLKIAFNVKDLPMAGIQPGWSGKLNGSGRLSGPLDDLTGTVNLDVDKAQISDQKISHLSLDGRLEGGGLHVERFKAALATGQTLEGQGWASLDRRFRFSLQGRDLALANIAALQRAYPVDGRLTLEVQGRGTFAQPDIQAELQVANPRFEDLALEDFKARASLKGRRLELEADLNFTVRANADLDSGAFDIFARLDRADLSPYLALWAGANWTGQMSGQLQASGNWHDPAAVVGSLTLENASLEYGRIPLARFDRLAIRLNAEKLDLPVVRITVLKAGYLEIQASGDLSSDLDIRLDGRLPMAAAAPFTDQITDMQGALQVQARAQGALRHLEWQGNLFLEKVGFYISRTQQAVSGLQGRILLSPNEVTVKQLAGAVDTGSFSLNGHLALADLKPSDGRLDLEVQSLPLQWPGYLDALVSGNLSLSGRPEQASLQGELVLLEGTYYKDVRLNLLSAFTGERQRPDIGPALSQKPTWMEHIALDVSLAHRNPFLVDNNVAQLQIAPDLKAGGTLAHPVLSGRAKVVQGELIYRRKAFTVKRGVVDFINPYKTEPVLDIVSQAQIRRWLVTLSVSGTPDKLAIDLKSDPPEADNDILSLILLGRTNTELAKGEGGGKQTTQQMLAALVSTAWGEDIKRTAGVDILEVETGSQQADTDSDRLQVTVGKQLSRRLTVKYEVETSEGEMVQRAVSEYRFLENLLASGFQDSQGDYGAELLFRMEF
ncbi:MAG: translocation/assembly module TamB domain-containing protein [Desulfosarcinaceae bacterium]